MAKGSSFKTKTIYYRCLQLTYAPPTILLTMSSYAVLLPSNDVLIADIFCLNALLLAAVTLNGSTTFPGSTHVK